MTVEAGVPLALVQQAAADDGPHVPAVARRRKEAARSAAICRPMPAATRCCASATRAISSLGIEVVLADGRDLGRPARLAQGQHRLRPEAALHRRRRNARHRHGRRAEALPGAAHARRRRWPRCPTSRRRSPALRTLRQALGDRLTGFELMSAYSLALSRKHHPALPDPLPGHPWYVLRAGRRQRERFAACRRSSNARSQRALEAGIVAGRDDRAVGRAGARTVGAAREHRRSAAPRRPQHQARHLASGLRDRRVPRRAPSARLRRRCPACGS